MAQQKRIGRRDFLRIVGVSGVAGLAAFMLDREAPAQAEMVSETRLLMGTVVNLTLVTSDRDAGRAAITACLDQMAGLEAIMSRYQPDSQLSHLNRTGQLDQPSAHLVRVLHEAQRISTLTGGAFDVTVKPLVDLCYQRQKDNALPRADAVEAALAHVDYRKLSVDDRRVAFAQPGMAITLDGIAKGYIVDQGLAVLRQHGFSNVLVEAGGDLASSGSKPQQTPWSIGIRSPRGADTTMLTTFTVNDQAVATSGDYMQSFTGDLRLHHILDPRAGISAPELASATIAATNALAADALATAVMVLGLSDGLSLIEGLPDCEACLVTKDAQMQLSSGFPVA